MVGRRGEAPLDPPYKIIMSELPPAKEVIDALKFAVAPSATATAGTAVALGGLLRLVRKDWAKFAPLISVVALAAGLATGNASREVFPWTPDEKPWHWALWAFGLAFAVEAVANLPKLRVAVGFLLRGTAAGVVAAFVVPPSAQAAERWWIPAVAFATAGQWALVAEVGRRNPGGWVAAAMAVASGGAAAVLIHAESAGFTDIATVLLTGLAVLAGLAWLTGTDAGPAAAVAVVPVASLLVLGRLLRDSDVTGRTFVIAAFAPAMLGVTLLPGVSRLNGKADGGLLKVAVVAGSVLWVVYRVMQEAPLKFGEQW
jgi:hypothetical protein